MSLPDWHLEVLSGIRLAMESRRHSFHCFRLVIGLMLFLPRFVERLEQRLLLRELLQSELLVLLELLASLLLFPLARLHEQPFFQLQFDLLPRTAKQIQK